MLQELEPMTEVEAQDYIPQWGSLVSNGDPGYICYTAIPPEAPEHRDTMIAWLRDCIPDAEQHLAEGHDEFAGDPEQLQRAIAYLEALTY